MSVKVLHICASLSRSGGVQTVIQNYYAYMNQKEYIFDIVVMGIDVGELEEWFESRGSRVYHVTPRSVSFRKNTRELKQILKAGNYDAVHCHQDYKSLIALIIAKLYGVRTRIVHSHQAFPKESTKRRVIRGLSTLLIKCFANVFIGCSKDAARWLYGERMVKTGKAIVLNNAINLEKYAFSDEKRKHIRSDFGIDHQLVIGNAARFTYQKNHKLLMDVFAEFHARNPQSVLLLAGDGELMDETQAYCEQLGICNSVMFLGVRSDIGDLLSAMDIFLLPSRFEGLALIMIEAQANGIPAVCSPFVTKELGLQRNVLFVQENNYENTDAWCSVIENALDMGRLEDVTVLTPAGYDIRQEAQKLEKIYEKRRCKSNE